ncbi:MAG: hypothetical protein NC253_13300 [Ruminococcus sp.]|nr:hypothetical protein [Ruminococcus sp.]MCM1381098.1 hypothetical protein [Muribaculaceae bacterium]MCM1478690.1 hypothetical protein [Muribaculaceae bacterium]
MRIKSSSNFSLRSAYRSSVNARSARKTSKTSGSESLSSGSVFRGSALSGGSISSMRRNVQNIKISGGYSHQSIASLTADVKYKSAAVSNFQTVDKAHGELESSIPQWLEAAGVPSGVSFEFDYNIDSQTAEVTKISDEKYRQSVENVLNKYMGNETLYTAYASKIMNGDIASAYYASAAKSLESCFGQDIEELSLDRNGNLTGANANLQRAIRAQKNGREYTSVSSRKFPSDDIEGLLERLLSEKNITANVSHMVYGGGKVYTNDGKIKVGKNMDTSLLSETRYMARGSIALYGTNDYDNWVKNEKNFK